MKSFKYPNGVVLTWDDELVPGDLITTYYSGIYRFVKSEPRGQNGELCPLFHFLQVYTADGRPRKAKKTQICDASFCRRYTSWIEKEIQKHEEARDRLKKIMKEN